MSDKSQVCKIARFLIAILLEKDCKALSSPYYDKCGISIKKDVRPRKTNDALLGGCTGTLWARSSCLLRCSMVSRTWWEPCASDLPFRTSGGSYRVDSQASAHEYRHTRACRLHTGGTEAPLSKG